MNDAHDTSDTNPVPIRRRTSAACDACRERKVKCRRNGSSCTACLELEIPCTVDKPRKRRGPKNKYLRARLQHQIQQTDNPPLDPPALSGFSREFPGSPETRRDGLVDLGPLEAIKQIIQDWFNLVHPVAPIHHPALFIRRLDNEDAGHDTSFRVLIASVCAATVGSLPRNQSKYSPITVERCLALAEANGFWSLRQKITFERCLSLYHFSTALAAEQGMDNPDSFRLLSEAVSSVQYMLYYELSSMPFLEQQLLKRLYWLLFAGMCTMDMHGRPHLGLLVTQDLQSLVPLELADVELLPLPNSNSNHHDNLIRNTDSISYVPGLNHLANLFSIWQSSQRPGAQKSLADLQTHVLRAQRALDTLPPELTWHTLAKPSSNKLFSQTANYSYEPEPDPASVHYSGALISPDKIRPSLEATHSLLGDCKSTPKDFGHAVQMVNLYITQLHIRSNLLEQMNTIAKSQGLLLTPREIVNERHNVVAEMLDILYHMPQEVFDANGYSIVPKIRDIGSTLLDDVRTGGRRADGSGGMNLQASINLDLLLKKLESLDVRPVLTYNSQDAQKALQTHSSSSD